MSLFKNLFKQTAIYGLATVVPRMLSFLLVGLYTKYLPDDEYGDVNVIFSWIVLFNVILAYGMETSFFRFYSTDNSREVESTSTISLFWSSIGFLFLALLGRTYLANWSGIEEQYITYTIWILVLDALVIIPFSKLRAQGRPLYYTAIKVGNVVVNLGLNVVFIALLPAWAAAKPSSFWGMIYIDNFQIGYIFVSNLIASFLTLLVLAPHYFKINWSFDKVLWKKMMRYSLPVLVAGIAFAINESFDRILLENLLPEDIAKAKVGQYSACYKIALFMTLYATAFRLGIEPFFFSYAKNESAPKTYAMITKYFIIFGSLILVGVVVFADVIKVLLIKSPEYWEAMKVVPLIILANFFLGIYHNLSVWYKLTDKTKMGAYISIVGALVTLGLNFLLIEKYDYMGSAIATISAYGTMMIISYFLGNKYYPIPYDLKKIGGYLGLSISMSLVYFYYFRENYYVGAAVIIVYSLFIYQNEKETLNRVLKRK
ncbi:polysaccharide biosynthesis protein [Flavobacterium beibuense F44-8]|uniref:Polysaccharide biosynthesis protein n=1 Tax=Flavobacterium beibuense F44-8 TaxID=1406840 RepID=A0A0A2LSI1_9FLAO|nr:polysaccharide biosynthesis C-terminal domain-containing protein [Flavobacterium beibuense]KGO83282.1 polysaccharide biosynthesis protein [Flavobacterium beibuense F44-8]